MKSNLSIDEEIETILNNNKISDLKKFLNKRSCLNESNVYLTYLFHIIQSFGILCVSVSNSYELKYLSWIGIGLNSIASVIHIITQDNTKINKTLFTNIQKIKDNNYLDESIIDIDSRDDKPETPKIKLHSTIPTLKSASPKMITKFIHNNNENENFENDENT